MFLDRSSVSPSVLFFCQCNFSKTALQNLMKLCSYKEHDVFMHIFAGNSDSIFFLGVMPILE